MKNKNTLGISFYYGENDIIYTDRETGKPIKGNQIIIDILGQVFGSVFKITKTKPKSKIPKREFARLFGCALEKIGIEIQLQATNGLKRKIKVNGKIIHFF